MRASWGFAIYRTYLLRPMRHPLNVENDRSLALVNRIGLHYECLRRGFYYENAQWVDHQIYVGLPRDFGLAEQPPNSGHSWGAGG
jgi:hypothetical protein